MNVNKVAIIGAGPAGIACAIQLSRYGIEPLLFERDEPGGLLKNANLVENYPGFPGGIRGISLIKKMTKQLEISNVPVIRENVRKVSYQDNAFKIETDFQKYSAGILVIATGTSPIEFPGSGIGYPDPGTRNLEQGTGNTESEPRTPDPARLFYEVYPLRDIRDARIVIIGAGDAAFDYALQLSAYNKVMIFNRSQRIKCLPLLEQRAKGTRQIAYYEKHVLKQLIYDDDASCLKLTFQNENKVIDLLADYIIFATGRRPELSFIDPSLFNRLKEFQQKGKLFLAGDVKNDLLRQASIAAGEGIRAAMEIYFNESNTKNKR